MTPKTFQIRTITGKTDLATGRVNTGYAKHKVLNGQWAAVNDITGEACTAHGAWCRDLYLTITVL